MRFSFLTTLATPAFSLAIAFNCRRSSFVHSRRTTVFLLPCLLHSLVHCLYTAPGSAGINSWVDQITWKVSAPKHLRADTAGWFSSITREHEWDYDHDQLVVEACKSWDRSEQAKVLAKHGVLRRSLVEGRTGGSNPWVRRGIDRHMRKFTYPQNGDSAPTGLMGSVGLRRRLRKEMQAEG